MPALYKIGILLLATASPALVTLILAYYFRVDEDNEAVFTSIGLGTALFVTSIGSTVVHMLYGIIHLQRKLTIGLGMELMAYKAARLWLWESKQASSSNKLPTPLQYGIALKITSTPGIESMWTYLKYSMTKSRRMPRTVTLLGIALVSQLFLGTLTSVADTWLHLTATTVPRVAISTVPSPSSLYSRTLFGNCTSGPFAYRNESGTQSCTIPHTPPDVPLYSSGGVGGGGAANGLFGVAEGLSTLNNVSKSNFVVYVDNVAFIAPAVVRQNVSFTANSHGLRTNCTPISNACNFSYGTPGSSMATYDCKNKYPGVRSDNSFSYGFSSIWFNLTLVGSEGVKPALGTGNNPFNIFIEATIDTPARGLQDPEFVAQAEGTQAILLWCEIEVLDVAFSMGVDVPGILHTNQSSNATTYAISSIFASSPKFPAVSQSLWLAAEMAAMSGNSSAYANQLARQLSIVGIGLGAGAMASASTLSEVTHTYSLVSRLPKAPLFTLVCSFLLYALTCAAIALSILFTRKSHQMTANEIEIVKARLADPLGIVQEHFGDAALIGETNVKQMFYDERDRVLRVRGVWEREANGGKLFELVAGGEAPLRRQSEDSI